MLNIKSLPTKIVLLFALVPVSLQAAPVIEHWKTDNGANVYYAHAPGLPIVDLRIVFDGGSARDGNKSGLSSIVNHMLSMGAGELGATEIARRFENVGAEFSSSSDRDLGGLKLRSLSQPEWLNSALDTLELVLTKPNFSNSDFERERKRYLISLQREQQSPSSIASRAFYKAVYGDHPYANMPNGTEATLKALKRQDLEVFFKRYYVARNATVAIVGDLDRKQAEKIVARLFKNVAAGKAAEALPKVKDLTEAKVIRIAHPSSQTHVLMGHPGNYRGDPDYFPMYLGNHALGGSGLVSRLSDEVREKRGLSYSVYSYFSPLRRKGLFQVGMQTKNDQVDEGVKVLRKTISDYVEKGMTKKEREASLSNITGGFPLRVDSNKKILGYLSMLGYYKLPLTYLNEFNARVEAVSLSQVHDVMRRRVHADKMVTVIVGGGQ